MTIPLHRFLPRDLRSHRQMENALPTTHRKMNAAMLHSKGFDFAMDNT
jgi:hypothetical protein